MGSKTNGRKRADCQGFNPFIRHPPDNRMNNAAAVINEMLRGRISFQYRVCGCRQGERRKMSVEPTRNKAKPANPAVVRPWITQIVPRISSHRNDPSQPPVQPIFSPRR